MRLREFHRCERGTSAIELTLLMPAIVFVMLFLIGMGHTLITRQHAVAAARFSAAYHAAHGRAPSPQQVSRAAANGEEQWKLSGGAKNGGGDAYRGIGGGVAGIISSVFGSFIGSAGQGGKISYFASTTPNRGLLPRIHRIGDTTAQCHLVSGAWTCDRGSGYLSLILSKAPIPGVSFLTGGSCCRPYESR